MQKLWRILLFLLVGLCCGSGPAFAQTASSAPVQSAGLKGAAYQIITLNCPIQSLKTLPDGSATADLACGRAHGLVEGGRGGIWSKWDKEAQRDTEKIGESIIVRLQENTATAQLYPLKEKSSLDLIVGDLVETTARVPILKFPSLIFEISQLGIGFVNYPDEDSLFSYLEIIHQPNLPWDQRILQKLLEEVQQLAPNLDEWLGLEPLTGSRFKGLTMRQAFEKSTPQDLRDFVAFVISYPGKYMGTQWRFGEVYATWLLNEAPISPRVLMERLLALKTPAEQLAMLRQYAKELGPDANNNNNLGFFSDWYDMVWERTHKPDYASSEAMVQIMELAAGLVSDPRALDWVYRAKGDLLYSQKKFDQAIALYQKAIAHAEKHLDLLENSHSYLYHDLALCYYVQEQYLPALNHFQTALKLKLALKQPNLWSVGHSYRRLGDTLSWLNRYPEALEAYEAARKLYHDFAYREALSEEAYVLSEIAKVLRHQGNYRESIRHWEQARELFHNLVYLENEANALRGISYGYWDLGDYQQALTYQQQALQIREAIEDAKGQAESMTDMGSLNWNLGKYQQAESAYQQALKLYRQQADAEGEADVLKRSGNLLKDQGNLLKAQDFYQQSLALLQRLDKKADAAELLIKIADVLQEQKKYPEAEQYYRQAFEKYQGLHSLAGQAEVLASWGWNDVQQKQIAKALEKFEQNLAVSQQIGDKAAIFEALKRLGEFYRFEQNIPKADQVSQQALEIARQLPSQPKEAEVLLLLSGIQSEQGKFEESRQSAQKSLSIYQQIQDKAGMSAALLTTAWQYQFLGNYTQARTEYENALKIARDAGQKSTEARSLQGLAALDVLTGRYEDMQQRIDQALKIYTELNDELSQAQVYDDLGNVYKDWGNLRQALEYHQKALALRESWGYLFGRLASLNNIGLVYDEQRDYTQAASYFLRSWELGKQSQQLEGLIIPAQNLARIYAYQGSYDKAVKLSEETLALTVSKQLPRYYEGSIRRTLGLIYRLQKQWEPARKLLEQAQQDALVAPQPYLMMSIQLELGIVNFHLGQYPEALKLLEQAMAQARTLRRDQTLWEALYYQGLIYLQQQQTEPALKALTAAVETLERMRKHLLSGEGSDQMFTADKQDVYKNLVDLLLKLGRQDEAWQYIGLMKSQEMQKLMRSNLVEQQDPQQQQAVNTLQSLQSRELELSQLLQGELKKPQAQQRLQLIDQWQEEIDRLRLEFDDFIKQLSKNHPDLYQRVQIEPSNLLTLQGQLKDNEAFIEPVVLPDKIVIFVVRSGEVPLIYRQIPARDQDVYQMIHQMRLGLANSQQSWQTGSERGNVSLRPQQPTLKAELASQKLYDLLIKPIQQDIKGVDTLIISSSGRLRYIPFQALTDGQHFLVESYRLAMMTQASAFKVARTQSEWQKSGVLAIGNPDGSLPGAEAEVKALGEIWPNFKPLYGGQANKRNLRQLVRQYGILHLATHGFLLEDQPEDSYLLLAGANKEDYLTFRDIPLLPLQNVEIATLSACQTALGDRGEGVEIAGLAYQFVRSGASTVIATLWSVNDQSTSTLMQHFYTELRQTGIQKAEALRQAQLKLIQKPETRHPYYWAPFILLGDWR